MNWLLFQVGAASFMFGLLIGVMASLAILKKLVNVPLQRVYKALNQLSLYKLNLRGKHSKKTERIKALTEKYEKIHDSRRSEIIDQYKIYLNDLNQVLEDRGIGGITPRTKL